jgi:hypothetical protein
MNSYGVIKLTMSVLDVENLNPPDMWLNAKQGTGTALTFALAVQKFETGLTALNTASLITLAIIK